MKKVRGLQRKNKLLIGLVCLCTGFMLAIQFQSNQTPQERDTRDLWEIRTQLQQEQRQQQQLYQEISQVKNVLDEYEAQSEPAQMKALNQSIQELEIKAGMTEKSGPGVIIKIDQLFMDIEGPQSSPVLTPDLLHHLINELNQFGASDLAIEGQRMIDITPIRLVNDRIYVNNHPLPGLPVEIYVLANNAERLIDYIEVSNSNDYFAIENLKISTEKSSQIELPAYDGILNLQGINVNAQYEVGDE